MAIASWIKYHNSNVLKGHVIVTIVHVVMQYYSLLTFTITSQLWCDDYICTWLYCISITKQWIKIWHRMGRIIGAGKKIVGPSEPILWTIFWGHSKLEQHLTYYKLIFHTKVVSGVESG